MRPIREGMTISRGAGVRGVTWFSLGAGTDISRESYDVPTLYLCAEGRGEFLLGEGAQNVPLLPDELLIVPGKRFAASTARRALSIPKSLLKGRSS